MYADHPQFSMLLQCCMDTPASGELTAGVGGAGPPLSGSIASSSGSGGAVTAAAAGVPPGSVSISPPTEPSSPAAWHSGGGGAVSGSGAGEVVWPTPTNLASQLQHLYRFARMNCKPWQLSLAIGLF